LKRSVESARSVAGPLISHSPFLLILSLFFHQKVFHVFFSVIFVRKQKKQKRFLDSLRLHVVAERRSVVVVVAAGGGAAARSITRTIATAVPSKEGR